MLFFVENLLSIWRYKEELLDCIESDLLYWVLKLNENYNFKLLTINMIKNIFKIIVSIFEFVRANEKFCRSFVDNLLGFIPDVTQKLRF